METLDAGSVVIQNGQGGSAVNATGQQVLNAINTTNPQNNFNIGSSSTSWDMYHPKTLVDARITEETVELKYIQRAKYSYTQTTFTIGGVNGNGYQTYSPDLAIKEIYGCRDGKLTLLKTVTGRVIPPQDIPETLEFDDEIE